MSTIRITLKRHIQFNSYLVLDVTALCQHNENAAILTTELSAVKHLKRPEREFSCVNSLPSTKMTLMLRIRMNSQTCGILHLVLQVINLITLGQSPKRHSPRATATRALPSLSNMKNIVLFKRRDPPRRFTLKYSKPKTT